MEEDCPFCPIEKKTEWYYEDDLIVVCDTLGGTPMVVIKRHDEQPTYGELKRAEEEVWNIFGRNEFKVLMNVVEDHWHAHIREIE